MKNVVLLIASTFVLISHAFADSISCTLIRDQDNETRLTAELELNNSDSLDEGVLASNDTYDFSFHLSAGCTGEENPNCGAVITIYSGLIEDEFRNTGIDFQRSPIATTIFRESIQNKLENSSYQLTCEYQPAKQDAETEGQPIN